MKLYEATLDKHHEYSNCLDLHWACAEAKGLSYALGERAFVIGENNRPLFIYENGKCIKRPRIKIASCAASQAR